MAQYEIDILTPRRDAGLDWAYQWINVNDPPSPADHLQAPWIVETSPGVWEYPDAASYANFVMNSACESYANAGSIPPDEE